MSNNTISQKPPLITVGIDQISDEDGKFCMSYGFDNSTLKKSISQVGIINNPFVFRNNKGSIEVVTGLRRILALKELGIKKVECFDLTDSGMTPYAMLKFAIYDNLFNREFNLVEKSLIIKTLLTLVKDVNSIKELTSLINVNHKDYDLILKLESLDESIKKSISSGALNIKALERLVELSIDNQLICSNWINNLKLNYNQQVLFIDYITDISRIEKIAILELLNDEYFRRLLADKKKNTPQKAKILIDNLRERRNPDYSRYQQLFEKRISKLQLPKNIKIKYPRYFEEEYYQLEVEFKDGNELRKGLKDLIEKDELATIGDPWLNE